MDEKSNAKKWVDISDVKSRLERYKERKKEIRHQTERLETIEADLENIKSPNIDGMPKTGYSGGERMTELIAKKDNVKASILRLKKKNEAEYKWIEDTLDNLLCTDEKTVIRVRYIDGADWEHIEKILFGAREDYEEKQDSYQRRTMRLHKQALIDMARITQDCD